MQSGNTFCVLHDRPNLYSPEILSKDFPISVHQGIVGWGGVWPTNCGKPVYRDFIRRLEHYIRMRISAVFVTGVIFSTGCIFIAWCLVLRLTNVITNHSYMCYDKIEL